MSHNLAMDNVILQMMQMMVRWYWHVIIWSTFVCNVNTIVYEYGNYLVSWNIKILPSGNTRVWFCLASMCIYWERERERV